MIIDFSPDRAAGAAAGVAVVDDVVNGVGAGAAPETEKQRKVTWVFMRWILLCLADILQSKSTIEDWTGF